MTEKDLGREIVLSDTVAERGRQVLELSQRCNALEQERDTLTHERDSLLERIRELETRPMGTPEQCAQNVPTPQD